MVGLVDGFNISIFFITFYYYYIFLYFVSFLPIIISELQMDRDRTGRRWDKNSSDVLFQTQVNNV